VKEGDGGADPPFSRSDGGELKKKERRKKKEWG
jgi:hypothetical protein